MRSLSFHGVTWYDQASLDEGSLRTLQKRYGFHDLDIEDCLSEHERPKVEEYEDYLFLLFHIPYINAKKSERILQEEVNIFLGKDFIITLHNGRVLVLEEIWHRLQRSEVKKKEYLGKGPSTFLYTLMNELFDGGFPLVDGIRRQLRHMEEELFENEEEVDVLRDLLTLRRNIITMRSILLPQRSLIAALESKNKKFFPSGFGIYFGDILDAIERQTSLLETAKELSEALQDTHESSLSHKTNTVIRILTIISVTLLPLTFLTGLYGMNVELPLQDHPNVFLILILFMLSIVAGVVGYFSWKRWL